METVNLVDKEPVHENDPSMKFAVISNVWFKLMHFKNAGDFNQGHKHLFDHATLLCKGSVEVYINGKVSTFTAPTIIFIEREKVHKIIALEPDTVVCCVHALRDGNETSDIVHEDFIPRGTHVFDLFKEDSGFGLSQLAKPN